MSSQNESHVFQLLGQAKAHVMYLSGGDDLTPGVESLSLIPHVEDAEGTNYVLSVQPENLTQNSDITVPLL